MSTTKQKTYKITLFELITKGDLSDTVLLQKILIEDYFQVEIAQDQRTIKEYKLIDGIPARLFIRNDATSYAPAWLRYLEPIVAERPFELKSTRSPGAILLVKPDNNHLFAATWGSGRYLLQQTAIKKDLGIICALNILSGATNQKWVPNCIRSITSKRVDANTLNAEYQFANLATIEEFPIIRDVDQLRSVTGTPVDKDNWGTITGGVSLTFRTRNEAKDIVNVCQQISQIMKSDDYSRHFEFAMNIKLADINEEELLKAYLLKVLQNGEADKDNHFFISPPEILDWDDISSFRYHYGSTKNDVIVDEPDFESFSEFIQKPEVKKDLSTILFTDKLFIQAIDENGDQGKHWPLVEWIGCDLTNVEGLEKEEREGYHFIFDSGDFYKVVPDYFAALEKFVKDSEITQDNPQLFSLFTLDSEIVKQIPWWLKDIVKKKEIENKPFTEYPEDNYVNALVRQNLPSSIRLHKRTVQNKDISTAIEICDAVIETIDEVSKMQSHCLVHLKVGTNSEPLSHLFSQALVSAELICTDPKFHEEILKKVKNGIEEDNQHFEDLKYTYPSDSFNWFSEKSLDTHKLTIVMGVVTDKAVKKEANQKYPMASILPFFSKVNYRMRCQELAKMGYQFKIVKINKVAKEE